jgi:hypothetical protein
MVCCVYLDINMNNVKFNLYKGCVLYSNPIFDIDEQRKKKNGNNRITHCI